jgi:hypothetical protein
VPFVAAGDLNGDGRNDLVLATYPLTAISGANGAVLWTGPFQHGFVQAPGGPLVSIGDLDGDSKEEFAFGHSGYGTFLWPGNRMISIVSGSDGRILFAFRGRSAAFARALAAIGDIDGDGFMEILQGDVLGLPSSENEATVLSTQATVGPGADAIVVATGPGSTPYLAPSDPPSIGSTLTLNLLDAPNALPGVLGLHVAHPVHTVLLDGAVLLLDPSRFNEWILWTIIPDAFGTADFPIVIPSDPIIAGTVCTLQAAFPRATGLPVLSTGVIGRIND